MTTKHLAEPVWTTRSGVIMRMCEMTDTHLDVAIDMTQMMMCLGEEKKDYIGNGELDGYIYEHNTLKKEMYELRRSKLKELLEEKVRRNGQ